jgi:hypothetical protein
MSRNKSRSRSAGGAFWSDQVAAVHEFYDYADEHFGWAETAETEHGNLFADGGGLA